MVETLKLFSSGCLVSECRTFINFLSVNTLTYVTGSPSYQSFLKALNHNTVPQTPLPSIANYKPSSFLELGFTWVKGIVCVMLKLSDRCCIVSADPQEIFRMPPIGQNCAVIVILISNKKLLWRAIGVASEECGRTGCLGETFANNCPNSIFSRLLAKCVSLV